MWLIEDFEIRTIQLDFTSSSGGRPRSRSIFANEVQLVNAADFVKFSVDPIQVHVCEQCGVVGCSTGGYVRLRRVGEYCIWLPDFASMLARSWESQQFAPPGYLEDQGIPVIHCSTYAKLESEIGQFPSFQDLRQLLASDAARIVQWDAPLNLLRTVTARPTLVKQVVLAVSEGDVECELNLLQATLNWFLDQPDRPVEIAVGGRPVTFYVDGPHFPSWTPMQKHEEFSALQFIDQLAVRIAVKEY